MRQLAVLGKEARGRMRGWRSAALLTFYLVLLSALGIGVIMLFIDRQAYSSNANAITMLGQQVFSMLALLQILLIVFIVPALTAGAIAGERERQTFDLLLTTRLSSAAIVFGKLLSSTGYILLLIIAAMPVFSLAFLFGGISLRQFGLVTLLSLVTALMMGSTGIFLSTMLRRVQVATAVAYLLALLLTFGIGIVSSLIAATGVPTPAGPPPPPALVYLNPLAALVSIMGGSTYSYNNFLGSISFLIGYSPYSYGPGGIQPLQQQWPLWMVHLLIDAAVIVVLMLASIIWLRPRRWLPRLPRRHTDTHGEQGVQGARR